MQISAVQTAVDLREFVIHIPDVEITPLPVIGIVAQSDEELAHGRRHFGHGAVVAEGWVVIVGIEAPE